jgi:hypothetical protein
MLTASCCSARLGRPIAEISREVPIKRSCLLCVSNTDGGRRQTYRALGQVRQDAVRPQKRAPDYRVVTAWPGFLIFIGAGAFALGMAIYNESFAQRAPRLRANLLLILRNGRRDAAI